MKPEQTRHVASSLNPGRWLLASMAALACVGAGLAHEPSAPSAPPATAAQPSKPAAVLLDPLQPPVPLGVAPPWVIPPPPPPPTEEDLKHEALALKRAQERWAAIRAGQYDQAYEFISPAGRLTLSKDRHINNLRNQQVDEHEVTRAICRKGQCEVTVLQSGVVHFPRVGRKQQRWASFERWIIENDQAWLLIATK